MSEQPTLSSDRGAIAWMAKNRVTPNLLMLVFIIGGFMMTSRIKQEVFPEFDEDMVNITVAYPGASPEEVEQGIVLVLEEAVRGIDGVKEVSATAGEGIATVNIELLESADDQRVYQDIKQEVDRITTFPEEAEEPRVSLATHRHQVVSVVLHGDVEERVLRELAEHVRDQLLQDPGITQVDLAGAREYEISVDVSQETLRTYNLTLEGIAQAIDRAAIEIPGGSVETDSGEILMRMTERRDFAHEFADIPIVTSMDGTEVALGDIATIRETFEDSDVLATYDGQLAMSIDVYRIGDQTPIGVSDAVKGALAEIRADLPPGTDLDLQMDFSDIYRQRLNLLLKNAFIGLILVFIVLGLFLEFKLAIWVTMGIPTSFLGTLLFLPMMDISINMISMFSFIIALGIVVDDAIVAGENIFECRQRGMAFLPAAIAGAQGVAMPITFSILTNIAAFLPLAFVPGIMGKLFIVIPLVVCTAFTISLIEALFILPAHLAHSHRESKFWLMRLLRLGERGFNRLVARFIEGAYAPFLERSLRNRYLVLACGVATLFIAVGYVASGRMGLVLMPSVESDQAVVTAVLPYGSPMSRAIAVRDRLMTGAEAVVSQFGEGELSEGIFALINENTVQISIYMTDPEVRPISTGQVTSRWRDAVGSIPGLESLKFQADRGGPGGGPSVTVELSHRDVDVLERASADLADMIGQFSIAHDIDDGFNPGKQQLDFTMLAEGESLGLTAHEVARQMRSAFYGAEALRQQRGRNEVKVMVRLPEDERVSEYDIEEMMVRTPEGMYVPLRQVAEVERGRAYTTITRREGRRTVSVTADVEPDSASNLVVQAMTESMLPQLERDYPGLSHSFEGHQADMRESLSSLIGGFALAMMLIYALLAIPFGSYVQPMIVMVSIPFGIIGAIIGHLIMGYSLSIISMMGIVALSGVVVNDSLVLIDFANRQRLSGLSAHDSVFTAGQRRFRPILLTTLTTFGGLTPMILETSMQARFMIPMAVSLGYGILFATLISLLLVPCLYLMVEDVAGLIRIARDEPVGVGDQSPS